MASPETKDQPLEESLADRVTREAMSEMRPTEPRIRDYMRGSYVPRAGGPEVATESMAWVKDYLPNRFLSTDIMALLHKRYDFSLRGFRTYFRKRYHDIQIHEQRFIPRRHAILGPDLASAHFVTFRQGKVRFAGSDVWYTEDRKVPATFDANFKLEIIDATGCDLLYEGLDNFLNLHHLDEFNLTGNKQLDDWACDKIARQFRFSTKLRTINLTGCSHVTDRGVTALLKIPSLTRLVVTDTAAAQYQFFDLFVTLFNDIRPNCEVVK
jgi:hypothetical protein